LDETTTVHIYTYTIMSDMTPSTSILKPGNPAPNSYSS